MEPAQTEDSGETVILIIAAVLLVISILWIVAMKYGAFKIKKKK